MVKTTKRIGKVMNPSDAYRKELRKKELKRNKKERQKVRELMKNKKDPDRSRIKEDEHHLIQKRKDQVAVFDDNNNNPRSHVVKKRNQYEVENNRKEKAGGEENLPSYVRSAATTVVRRPLAQHTPELTALVPPSVLVKRQLADLPKAIKPKSSFSSFGLRSIDNGDSYMVFLEDMKALGALDGC